LSSLKELSPELLATGDNIVGNVLIDATAEVDPTAVIGPNVVIGPGCKVGAGSKVTNTTLMKGSSVAKSSYVDGSIIGWASSIGSWCRVTNLSVIAEDV